jgi:hypothetical protein
MKHFKILLGSAMVILAAFFIYSCAKDSGLTQNSTQQSVENRSSGAWCDGGQTNPPAAYMLPGSIMPNQQCPNSPQLFNCCCVTFRFTAAYNNHKVSLSTTDFNFNTGTGNSGDNNIYYNSISGGLATFCFPQQGSHVLIQIYDANGFVIACNEFTNPCG